MVDFSPEAKEAAAETGILFVEGNGTDDDDLRAAGLERARGLIAASDDDADNLYITLSARAQNDRLFIVARASTEDAAKKLQLAGADRVVQPYQAAGRVMANLLLRPQVSAFVDVVTTMLDAVVDLRDVQIAARHADPRTTMRSTVHAGSAMALGAEGHVGGQDVVGMAVEVVGDPIADSI